MFTVYAPEHQLDTAPTPLQFFVAKGQLTDGTFVILLQVSTPTGVQQYYLPEPLARSVRDLIDQQLTGIVVAGAEVKFKEWKDR